MAPEGEPSTVEGIDSSAECATQQAVAASRTRIPRVVWLLWFQGWDKAPQVCRRCRQSFELWNPGWDVRALSEADLPAVLAGYSEEFSTLGEAMAIEALLARGLQWIPPAALADLVRLYLLSNFGGVWADATVLCRRPLDEWIDEASGSSEGFFAYSPEAHTPERIPVVTSFMASVPRHPIMVNWLNSLTHHWKLPSEQRPDLGYFWAHQLFGKLVEDNEHAKSLWTKATKLSGEYEVPGPHRLMPYEKMLARKPSDELRNIIEDEAGDPVFKLTIHDVKFDKAGGPYLLRRNGEPFGGMRAADSGLEYVLTRTMEQARERLRKVEDLPQQSMNPTDTWKTATPAEMAKYRLKIAEQPMMPG
eukprot:TRINITY_DN68529_c0_g1_i1.p1 TRINITY_DN68529_c0_g1~~TRINITY_DN68529_c0_g1_i1.p1  ORF type:complete len:374 (+),score=51.79 TRINITY_DN68529_c0_g1_i1:37-1122(+)